MQIVISYPKLDVLLKKHELLDSQISEAKKLRKENAILAIREVMKTLEISVDDLSMEIPRVLEKIEEKPVAGAKYRGPDGQTWSGRGRVPRWISESGMEQEKFLIKLTRFLNTMSPPSEWAFFRSDFWK